jgi:hypothetical protein
MLEIVAVGLWGCLTAYGTWYFTSAKNYAPLTVSEARLLWRIHKRNIRCNARKWQRIKRGGKIIGFKCECGYKHVQKRPIVSSAPAPSINTREPQMSAFEKLHASYSSE